jgi:hypothetical protein
MLEIVSVVVDDSLRATESGCEIQLRLKWYRSLSLSCIDKLEVTLDGQGVDPSLLSLGINGHEFKLDELDNLVEEYWFIQDFAVLRINQLGIVKRGKSHTINVEMAVRLPYIPIGPGRFLTQVNQYSAEQVAR